MKTTSIKYSPLMFQQDKGKQRIENSQKKNVLKSKITGIIEKSLQVAQKRGTKILKVPNPADPLKASNREESVQKVESVLLRLLASEAGNHRIKKKLKSLDLAKLKLVIRRLASSK